MPAAKDAVPLTAAQQALVEANLALAGWWLKENPWVVRRFGYDEAWSMACLALTRAAAGFREDFRAQFTTYAVQAMQHAAWQAVGYQNRAKRKGKTLSLHQELGEDGATLLDIVADRQADDPDLTPGEARERVADLMRRLTPREREVLGHRFFGGLTLEETGDRMGICKKRVWQIEARAFARLRGEPTKRADRQERRNRKDVQTMPRKKIVHTEAVEPTDAAAFIDRRIVALEAEHRLIEARLAELRQVKSMLGRDSAVAPSAVETGKKAAQSASPDVGADARKVREYLLANGPTTFLNLMGAVRLPGGILGVALSFDGWFAKDDVTGQ